MKASVSHRAELPAERFSVAMMRQPSYVPLALLLGLTLLAYLNSFAGTWQFDDHAVMLRDPRVQSWAAWWQSLPHLRPLFKLSVVANHELAGTLFGFHAVNLALHLINIALLYVLLGPLLRGHMPKSVASYGRWFVCIVFALHPAQTEVVTYLSGRSVALEATGLLLAACALQRWQLQQKRRWLVLMLVGVMFALASRESAVIAPLLLAWLSRQQRAEPSSSIPTSHNKQLAFALFCAALLLLLVLMLPRYRELLWLALQWPSVDVLVATQTQAISHLLAVAIAMAPINADPALQVAPLFSGRGQLTFWLLLVCFVYCWWRGRRTPLLRFALGWLIIVWLPTHSVFVRLDPVNDRQLYLALPALALLVFELLSAVGTRLPQPQRTLPTLLGLLLLSLLLGAATADRNAVYQSEPCFWQDVVNKAPHNARAWNNLGVAHAADGARVLSEQAFLQALRVQPDYVRAAVNLRLLRSGRLLSQQPEQAEP